MIPHHLDGRNEQTLLGGVYEAERRTKRYHIEVGIALREEATLQSGMNAAHNGFLAKQAYIGVLHNLLQLAMGTHLPGRIAVGVLHLGTSQREASPNGGTHIVEVGHHIGTLRRDDIDLALGSGNASNIAGSLHHSVQLRVLTDGIDTIIDSLDGIDETTGHLLLDDGLSIGRLHRPHHLRICDVELFLHVGGKDVPVGLDVLLDSIGNGNDEHTVTRDGIVHLAAIELGKTDAFVLLHLSKEEASEQLDGVGTLLVDIVAGMSAYQAFQLGTHEERAGRSCLTLEGELGSGVTTTGTADENLTLVLRIEVDEVVASHEAGFHPLGTCQSCLLVAGEDTLNGTVLDVFRRQQRQFHSTSDTVVGTQRGTLSGEPLTIDIGLDGVVVEIYLVVHEFVAHHIHVALQDDRLTVLHSLGGWFADDDVAGLVDLGV